MCEAGNKARADRIAYDRHHDRLLGASGEQRAHRQRAHRDDDIEIGPGEFGAEADQPRLTALSPTIFDRDVAAVHQAVLHQAALDALHLPLVASQLTPATTLI